MIFQAFRASKLPLKSTGGINSEKDLVIKLENRFYKVLYRYPSNYMR